MDLIKYKKYIDFKYIKLIRNTFGDSFIDFRKKLYKNCKSKIDKKEREEFIDFVFEYILKNEYQFYELNHLRYVNDVIHHYQIGRNITKDKVLVVLSPWFYDSVYSFFEEIIKDGIKAGHALTLNIGANIVYEVEKKSIYL